MKLELNNRDDLLRKKNIDSCFFLSVIEFSRNKKNKDNGEIFFERISKMFFSPRDCNLEL